MTLHDFEARCRPCADAMEDRSLRDVSSPLEPDLALVTAWPFVYRSLTRRCPWEAGDGIGRQRHGSDAPQ